MREALTVVGFLLIVAFAALFAAPLYVDWNNWRETIAQRLTDHLGVPVRIEGAVEAHVLPQPWLSLHRVSIGEPGGTTQLTVEGVDGDLSLTALLRGDFELSNLVLTSPKLTMTAGPDGRIQPLSHQAAPGAASIDSFEVQDGSIHFADPASGQELTVDGLRLVGEARSLSGPFKAEGGLQIAGVPHTLKIATGAASERGLTIKATLVPADRPLTLDFDGAIRMQEGRPAFEGIGTLARIPVDMRGDKAPPEEPWTLAAHMTLTAAAMTADNVAVQIGPDERALKLTGTAEMAIGKDTRLDARLAAMQVDLDRFAGATPERGIAPLAALRRLKEALPAVAVTAVPAVIALKAQGVMLGGQLLQDVTAELHSDGTAWSITGLQAGLPGQGRLSLAGDVQSVDGKERFAGTMSLHARQASSLLAWMQGVDRVTAPNAARRLDLDTAVTADGDSVSLSKLRLAIDDATVQGRLLWARLAPDSDAGRVEADLTAKRLDLDLLPSAAALLPGASSAFSEVDVTLSAESLALAGVEAKTASGRVKVGGKLVVLEDVVVDDLGGTSLHANGRIDNIGAVPQGEIRVAVDGSDLTGLATALRRSPLPAGLLDAFAERAPELSPTRADIVVSFGADRRVTLDGKLGGTVTQFSLDLTGDAARPDLDARLRADSLDVVKLLRQIGLSPLPLTIPGRSTFQAALAGPLEGPARWSASFDGAGIGLQGSGKATGLTTTPAVDGRVRAQSNDVLAPAQLFGVALPGVLPGDVAEIDTGFRATKGRLVLDDLTGAMFGVPLAGAIAITPGSPGSLSSPGSPGTPASPVRVEGRLNLQTADALQLGSLATGSDLLASPSSGSVWSGTPFGAGALDGVTGQLALTADSLVLSPRLPAATEARAVLTLEPGAVSIDGLKAKLGGGVLSASLRYSRAAQQAALTGSVALAGAALDTREVSGRLDLSADVQGTGPTPAALVTSLTGGGTVALHQPRLPRLSETAFGTTVAAVDGGLAPELGRVRPLFEQSLAQAPLPLGDIGGSLSLAGGVLRLATTTARGATTGVSLSGALDLSAMTAKADLLLAPAAPSDGFGGPPPAIQVSIGGPLDALRRQVDVSSLTAWLTVRAAEQEAKKLEALEAEKQARDKALEDARRAEAARMQKLVDAQRAADEARKAEEARKAAEAQKRLDDARAAEQPRQPAPPTLPLTTPTLAQPPAAPTAPAAPQTPSLAVPPTAIPPVGATQPVPLPHFPAIEARPPAPASPSPGG
ncbi:AsmA family protein [Labrys wisconsinensis]|uniref:AsmA family protein n=1 Tax=Labrys wisconsinensis TaxID=425677 RepID=UPI0027D85928|nr:AsmA family protein [Labrys wisconsinensis]